MKEILIVSRNNACRSAMAEGWFKYYARGAANVTSAGIDPTQLDLNAAQSMMDAVIDITKHQPQNLNSLTSKEFDIVLVLDNNVAKTASSKLQYKNLYVFHFDSPKVSENSDSLTRKAYDNLRDDIENWAFDFIHQNIKRLI
jgi:arsenate reductase